MSYSTENRSPVALYIHIPFCKKKCGYCSFISYEGREDIIPAYLASVKRELNLRLDKKSVYSVYIGGGTPSLLSAEQVEDLLVTVRSLTEVGSEAEITMEVNPGTVNREYLSAIRKAGINRLSLGVQSFRDDELKLLGRIHTADEAVQSILRARESGFDNLNIDLIYGLPGQNINDWQYSLEKLIDISPEHVSLYSLTLEEDTPLGKKIGKGIITEPDPDIAADQYEVAGAILASTGYMHYEISNWAKMGYQCRHNMVYWQCRQYMGIGVAAHSYLDNHRLANTGDPDEYIRMLGEGRLPVEMNEEIDENLRLSETVILALRLSGGVSLKEIKARFGIDLQDKFRYQLDEMTGFGLIEIDDARLKLTKKGILLGNEVFQRFLP